jgi:hypothetical protein
VYFSRVIRATTEEAENESDGICLFDDEASLQGYLAGPLSAYVRDQPAFTDQLPWADLQPTPLLLLHI